VIVVRTPSSSLTFSTVSFFALVACTLFLLLFARCRRSAISAGNQRASQASTQQQTTAPERCPLGRATTRSATPS
jgi:hypothetical protein